MRLIDADELKRGICWNCKHQYVEGGETKYMCCDLHEIYISPDDYCSYGERIEE